MSSPAAGCFESLGAGFMSKHSATLLSAKLGLGTHQQQSPHNRARTMQDYVGLESKLGTKKKKRSG